MQNLPANDVTVRRLYDGGALVAEYDQNGALLRRFVHGPNTGADTPLVWYEGPTMSQAAARMLNTDLHGSVTSVTDFNGEPIAINRYDEYGRPQSGNVGRFQYTGQAWLPEIGLYYYKARMYSPTLGRFMQTDPIGYADGVNWYNYVSGDPVNGVDPSGLCHTELWGTFTTTTWSDGSITTHLDGLTTKTIGCEAVFGAVYQSVFGDGGSDQIVVTANNAKPKPRSNPRPDPGFMVCDFQWPICQRLSTKEFCADAKKRYEYYSSWGAPGAAVMAGGAAMANNKGAGRGAAVLAAIYAAGAMEAYVDLKGWCGGI